MAEIPLEAAQRAPKTLWAHIPTAFSVLRILLVLPIWLALQIPLQMGHAAALVLFALAASTDALDGWLARRLHAETKLGATVDIVADKTLVLGSLAALTAHHELGMIDIVSFALILVREFAVTALRLTKARTAQIGASTVAKLKTATQMGAIALIFAAPLLPLSREFGTGLLFAGACLGIISGAQYFLTRESRLPR